MKVCARQDDALAACGRPRTLTAALRRAGDIGSASRAGRVSLAELAQVRGMLKLPIEQDLHFRFDTCLRAYAEEARVVGRIQA